ncbi:MAG: response regulator transcription factor [Pseudomonadota bacterium]
MSVAERSGNQVVLPSSSLEKDLWRTAFVEPRSFVRQCLASAISETLEEPVVVFENCEELLAYDASEKWSTIVISALGETCSQEVFDDARRLRAMHGEVPIVLMCDATDEEFVRHALGSGAQGCIPTSLGMSAWFRALLFIRSGGVFAPADHFQENTKHPPDDESSKVDSTDEAEPESAVSEACERPEVQQAAKTAVPSVQDRGPSSSPSFTNRERAVIDELVLGHPNKLIAYHLEISESTVKVHLRNIMRKLGATNRTKLALIVQELTASG